MSTKYLQRPAREQRPLPALPYHHMTLPDGTLWTDFYRSDSGYLLRFPRLADFEISDDGGEVQVWPAPGVPLTTVDHLHLNQVLPLALSRQGKLVLHGSAVEIDGQGVTFLGVSGRGKSTLATSFATQGRRFLTDDGLQLEWITDQFLIVPSHPSVRLWEDSREALTSASTPLAPAVDFTTKARLLACDAISYCGEPLPLRRIYFLGEGHASAVNIRAMKPTEVLIALTQQCFILDVDQQDTLARHFEALCCLSNLPIHFELDYPRRYEELSVVKAAIDRHATEGHRA